MTNINIGKVIDHTLLKPDATLGDVKQLSEEGREHGFATVIVHSAFLEIPVRLLTGTDVRTGTVVDFCFGAASTEQKVFAARDAIKRGADDLDMVMNITLLKSGKYSQVEEEIRQVVNSARALRVRISPGGPEIIVKVIIECGLLTDEEKELACRAVVASGADFVKTSTGYLSTGALTSDVALMRRVVGPDFGVKASGGIRTLDQVRAMLAAGANRIGTSSGVAIIKEWQMEKGAGKSV